MKSFIENVVYFCQVVLQTQDYYNFEQKLHYDETIPFYASIYAKYIQKYLALNHANMYDNLYASH